MPGRIAVVAALDTKAPEATLILETIEANGGQGILIDVGVLGEPGVEPHVTRAQVAAAANKDIDDLAREANKATSMSAMTRGASVISAQLYEAGAFVGMIGIGGTAGTTIASAAMRTLPVGVPKMLVSTVASGDTRPYVADKDITMMYSVVDIAGINRISGRVLANAAAAITGMVLAEPPSFPEKKMIAASMFGNTTACIDRSRERLEKVGYEVLVFHATGAGGQTMESLISDNYFDAVLDLTTTEWADQLCGGVFAAGETRLDAAGGAGVPQVIAPGCLDMVNFGSRDSVPSKYQDRKLYEWNPTVTLMRTTPEENARLGEILATKANQSTGQVSVLVPLRGVSQLDSVDGEFWWPEADEALFNAIRSNLRPDIPLVEVDANINDPQFSDTATNELLKYLEATAS